MVTVVTQKIQRMEKMLAQKNEVVRREAIHQQQFISELNRKQLKSGTRADGSEMPPYKDGSKSPNAPGPIQLFDTGAFHAGIQPLFDDNDVTLIGTEQKTDLLSGKYGANIFGLSPQSLVLLRKRLLPGIIQRLKNLL